MRAWLLLLVLPLLLAACGKGHVAAPDAGRRGHVGMPGAGVRIPPPRADGRLPPSAIPRAYAIAFDVDPTKRRFSGRETIEVTLPSATDVVVLHARALTITSATITVGKEVFDASVYVRQSADRNDDERILGVARPLPPGPATLALEWFAEFDDRHRGVFSETVRGRAYAFTQFEPTDARSAFPCFDEPGFKTPFDISIRVPRGSIAIGNTRELSREDSLFRFARTAALPTYLVAFAVGEFDIRVARRDHPPTVRVITTKDQGSKADMALEATSYFVDDFATWLGSPYPFDKLDVVAVPATSELGMENAGLITMLERALLGDAAKVSPEWRTDMSSVIAHEVAHQWVGDLVTAEWWNEIWLNEGMATWLGERRLEEWKPAWDVPADVTLGRLRAMHQLA